jgi:protein-L-isoaspartate(D-aspartate) O-methyltransferase
MQAADFEIARRKMVDQQARPWEVLDQRVLDVLLRTPREDYVPEVSRSLAYIDMDLPIGHNQTMPPPKVQARLVQSLELGPKDKVLEIGTGTGYVTALLAQLVDHVYSVEIVPELAQQAKQNLDVHNIKNVTIDVGDGARGWAKHAPYDAILVTGSVPLLADDFKQQLAPNGRLVVVVGQPPVMEALLVRRLGSGGYERLSLFDTVVPKLINAPEPPKFVF